MSSGGKNIIQNLLLQVELWLNYCCWWEVTIYVVVSGGDEIMASCGHWWEV